MNENIALEMTWYFQITRIMLGMAFLAFIISLVRLMQRHNPKVTLLFAVYLLAVVMQVGITLTYHYLNYPKALYLVDIISANIFTVVEFCVFNLIFLRTIRCKTVRRFIGFSMVIFPAACFGRWLLNGLSSEFPYHISVIEAFILLIVCLTYFYELFAELPTKNLMQEPFFWFSTGALIYFVCLIPNFLILQYVDDSVWLNYETLAISGCVASITLHLFIAKALLCKTQQVRLS